MLVFGLLLGWLGHAFWPFGGAILGFFAGGLLPLYFYGVYNKLRMRTSGHPLHWLRARLGWGKSVQELAARLGLKVDDLATFQPSYREAYINKRNGQKRRLLVPDQATKVLQRCILRRLLAGLNVHSAAYGFVMGRSAAQNAGRHVGQAVLVNMDIVDFFPSTQAARIEDYFRRIGWNAESARLLTKLTTHEGGLPQGAPTSPALSNLVNYYADVQIENIVERYKGTYTRYADDLAISYPLDYPRHIHGAVERIKRVLKAKGYRVHSLKKLRIRRQHQRQIVTGLVVNAKAQLPRQTRRWLRAVQHRLAQGKTATLNAAQLQGWLSYEKGIREQASAQPPVYRKEDNRNVIRRRKRNYETCRQRRTGPVA